jgi:phosphate transport system substrate-binding protein
MLGRKRLVRLAVPLLAVALLGAACGDDDDDTTSGGGATVANGGGSDDLSGHIEIDGSSTVTPILEAISEEFVREAPDVDAPIKTSGTGGGFKRFCENQTDISMASRAIQDEEKTQCTSAGVEYTELRIGLDGLAVVSSAENEFLECLTFAEMAKIFGKPGAKTWNEVNSAFPAESISIFGPGTDSGTYDFFVEEVLGDPADGGVEPIDTSAYTASEDDNTLVQGIKGEKNSWGFFGFAYFQENAGDLKDIKLASEEGGECVEPTAETVLSGDYPLSRPLFIYVKNASLAEPHVYEYVKFALEATPELISDVGYVAAPEEDYATGLSEIETAKG